MWDNIIEQEKRVKIAKTGATAIGLGIGTIILQFFFPNEQGDSVVRDAFNNLGLTIILYGFSILTVFFFKPDKLRFFYGLATYFIVPVPVTMFIVDIVTTIMK